MGGELAGWGEFREGRTPQDCFWMDLGQVNPENKHLFTEAMDEWLVQHAREGEAKYVLVGQTMVLSTMFTKHSDVVGWALNQGVATGEAKGGGYLGVLISGGKVFTRVVDERVSTSLDDQGLDLGQQARNILSLRPVLEELGFAVNHKLELIANL